MFANKYVKNGDAMNEQRKPDDSKELDKLLLRRRQVDESRIALVWGTANAILATAMCVEICFSELLSYWYIYRPFLYYAAYMLAIVFIGNTLKHLVTYVRPYLYVTTLNLSATKHKLYRVSEQDPMVTIATSVAVTTPTTAAGPQFSPSSFTARPLHSDIPVPTTSFDDPYYRSNLPSRDSAPLIWPQALAKYLGVVPDPMRSQSVLSLHSASNTSINASPSYYNDQRINASPSYYNDQPYTGADLNASFNSSRASRGSPIHVSHYTPTTPDNAGIRSRVGTSTKSSPVLGSDECINDMKTLKEFLDHQDNLDNKSSPVHPTMSPTESFWNYPRSTWTDNVSSLRKVQYQIAPRSPQSHTSSDIMHAQIASSTVGDEMWSKLDVSPGQLDHWLENLRKWLRQTILVRVMDEVTDINKTLVHLGSDDVQIGHVTLATLRQVSVSKAQQLPGLAALIPYLDITHNQEYLIQRLTALTIGGCMSAFTWNGGGEFKGKNWEENLPTDSMIVMHLLCTYMDSRLPPHPGHPDGKTFTNQHFIKVSDKPNLADKKDHLCIYQTSINPPHYNVVVENHVWNVQKGRNNLFFAILVFLHHVKTKEHGMLRRVNLGLSGVNILWVIDS